MKFEVNIQKKHMFLIVGAMILLAGAVAFGGSNPSVVGHSSGEVEVNINGNQVTLQQAIDDGDLGGNIDWSNIQSIPSDLVGFSDGPVLYEITSDYCADQGRITTETTCPTISCLRFGNTFGIYDCSGTCQGGEVPRNCANTAVGNLVAP